MSTDAATAREEKLTPASARSSRETLHIFFGRDEQIKGTPQAATDSRRFLAVVGVSGVRQVILVRTAA